MRVAFVSSEMTPLAQTGGLGDMVASLSQALGSLGVNPVVILPKHGRVPRHLLQKMEIEINIPLGSDMLLAQVWRLKHEAGLPIYLLDIPKFFERDSLYGEAGKDYPDNCARFAAFNRGALELLKQLKLPCEILHLHDWHTALIPFYLKTIYWADPFFQKTRTLLTIHNLAYQGQFERNNYPLLGLDEKYFTPRFLEFYGRLNFMKAGILAADAVTTVSPSYAREVLTPQGGCGLDGVLRDRKNCFSGILNGMDREEWNPDHDPNLPAPFSATNPGGKEKCKAYLQEKLKLPVHPGIPLFASISRLVPQKGIDLFAETIPTLIDQEAQWVFLGSGDPVLEEKLKELARQHPEKIAVQINFDLALAHQIEAGSDFFVMPSRFEPCGLSQMYSLRYGSIPLVHAVGGLRDTVMDANEYPKQGTGFVLSSFTAQSLKELLLTAMHLYKNNPQGFKSLRQRAMLQDFSWEKSARAYLEIYRRL
ncbi:MAG: glycogen synthase GlgA [Deltaproteobacteria bacterium]|nr:glycogen synthase GlgA [Deltaproteobacteria bacterium]